MPRLADPGRGKLWAALGVIVALLVAWILAVALLLVHADRQLRSGIAAANRARAGLSLSDLTDGAASGPLRTAAQDFAAAHREVASPWVAPLRILPVIGTQVRSVDALSKGAATVAGAGRSALDSVRLLVVQPHHTPAERLALVTRLARVLGHLRAEVDGVYLGPSRGLVGRLAHERRLFAGDLAKVRAVLARADGVAGALDSMFQGKQSYLLLVANNAEMRAGSGMALEVGTIHLAGGAVRVSHLQDAGQLVDQFPGVRPTGDLAARWGFERPQLDLRELLMSPQFPANAAFAARMWQAHTGRAVGGVLLVDVQALADVLSVIGPVSAQGTTLTAANAVPYLLEGQYVGVVDAAAERRRHQRLGAIAEAALGRLEAPGSSLTGLVRALGQAAAGRHILAWSANPAVEADWSAAGAAGAVSGNEMLLALLNQAADKLDPYQKVTARASVAARGDASRVTVRVTVHNATPASLRGYAAGGAPGTPPAREYAGAVALDFPLDATRVATPGTRVLQAAGPDGPAQVLAIPVSVPDGRSVTVNFAFTLPGSHGSLTVEPSARIPPTDWEVVSPGRRPLHFEDAVAHTFRW